MFKFIGGAIGFALAHKHGVVWVFVCAGIGGGIGAMIDAAISGKKK